ncbi:MAG: hypothetical protein OXN88_14435 [Chloroflexota bacterium]|nr:hypothetical protein [Chloroflexota bacterium]
MALYDYFGGEYNCINLGRNGGAQQQYLLLERLLKKKLSVKPSAETQALLKLLD